MGAACGRYAPSGHSHVEEELLIWQWAIFCLNHEGVKIGLSQGVNFRLTFRLNGLAGTDEHKVTKKRVESIASAGGVSTRLELPSILKELNRQRLIDIQDEEILILGLTTPETLEHTATIFQESDPTGVELASLDIAEKASDAPIKDVDAIEYISDTHKIVRANCEECVKQYGHVGFIDSENLGNETIFFNGNLFRKDNIRKINGVLSSLDAKDERQTKNLLGIIDSKGCIPFEEAKTLAGDKLLKKLSSIGFIDINSIGNETGTHSFVTRPAAFKKYSNSAVEDAFDLAKAFVTSLSFGMTKSSPGRGHIRMIEALMNKLINGHWVGPATAIGKDYKVLELKGVIQVRPTGDGRFYMKLLKKDIGDIALKVITEGEAATTFVTQFPSVSATLYNGPEPNRTMIRKKQGLPLKKGVASLLDDLRTGGIR